MSVSSYSLDTPQNIGCGCAACQNGNPTPVLFEEDATTSGNNVTYAPSSEASPEEFATYLVSGFWNARSWSDTNITYSLSNEFTSEQKEGLRLAFSLWDDVADITLTEVSSGADIPVYEGDDGRAFSSTSSYNGSILSNYISIDTDSHSGSYYYWRDFNEAGDYALMSAIHEIGHSLGLGHTGNYNGSATYEDDAQWTNDSHRFTVMSYFNDQNTGADRFGSDNNWHYSASPMLIDILAIQMIYGADNTTRSGNTVYGFNSTADKDIYDFSINESPIAIWDGNGTDTLDLSGYNTTQTIYLTEGDYSSVGYMTYNLVIAYGAEIENAEGGSGRDTIYGNDLDNVINGNNGNDTIYATLGNDTLDGGAGNDTVIYSYDISDFLITLSETATFILEHIGDLFTDTISNFETFIFNGTSYSYSEMEDNVTVLDDIAVRFDWNIDSGFSKDNFTSRENGTSTFSALDLGVSSSEDDLVRIIRDNYSLTVNNLDTTNFLVERFSYFDTARVDLAVNDFREILINKSGNEDFTLVVDDVQRGTVYTGASDDTITLSTHEWTNAADDSISVNVGNGTNAVTINGTYGNVDVTLTGGTGEDNLRVNIAANSKLIGGAGNDTLTSNSGDDTLLGEGGDDILIGGSGNDTLNGGNGHDTITAGEGNDLLIGGSGSDTLYGNDGEDTLKGDEGNDFLYGGNDDDEVVGGDGDDLLSGGSGNDRIYGDGYTGQNISGADEIYGGDGDDAIYGGQGNDTINGGNGNDFIRGDQISNDDVSFTGDDIIQGGSGDDIIYGDAGNDEINGGDDDDRLYGGEGIDTINGGNGIDHIDGGNGNDILSGDAGDDRIFGRSGDDEINGGSGSDRLYGDNGAGDSTAGADTINGDAGDDWLYGGAGDDILNGGDDDDRLFGDNIGVSDDFTGNDTLNGGGGNDWLYGHDGDDILNGGDGNDYLYGYDDNDILNGGSGKDTLRGGNGDDTLNGGGNRDRLFGEAGADEFLFTADSAFNDLVFIRDFNAAEGDTINIEDLLSGFDAEQNDINDFISFTETATDSYLWVNPDGSSEFTIVARIYNNTGLDAETMVQDGELII